ncbi:calmodulin-binding protein 60 A isoform X1 [Capsicum chacoense]
MDHGENSPSYSRPKVWASFHRSVMVVLQVLRLLKSMRRLCIDPAAAEFEPETDEISTSCPRKKQENFNSCDDHCESRRLKLKFSNNINGPIYTGQPVGGDPGSTLNLDLVDCRTENLVKYGSEASLKVEIVALEKEAFRTATRLPDGKSLIRGDPHVNLKDGSVSVSHISFKHTRVPMKKRELRLGARAVYPCDIGARIMEAVTESFFVIDRRSIPKSKRPLKLDDQVWNLQTIGKGGAFHDRLLKENIKTVRDFLTHYFLNREKLLKILGRHMQVKKLDAAVNLAKSKLDLKRYMYPSAHLHENPQVVFTDVGELIGVFHQKGQFMSVESLTQTQKASGMEVVKRAFHDGHQNFKALLDDDSFKMLCSCSSPNKAIDLDGSNGFSSEAYNIPTDTKQLQPVPNDANYMPSTSSVVNNYCDYTNQVNSSSTTTFTDALQYLVDSADNDFNYQALPANIWD